MNNQIEVILFDMGGTLRNSVPKDKASKMAVVSEMAELLGAKISPEKFSEQIVERFKIYSRWARETLIEVTERELWTKWILPDWPVEQISKTAIQLNELWRQATAERVVFPETKDVIVELFRRGYRLGIVSNTVSSVEIPHTLQALEITGYFETIVLSCVVGMRKPAPGILLEAGRRMLVAPEKCVYVGNLLNRDVQAAQQAGFAQTIIRRDPDTFSAHQAMFSDLIADTYIDNLKELLDIFPVRRSDANSNPLIKASLSTMWSKKNFLGLSDFFEGASRLGFAEIELNHQVDSSMLRGIDLSRYPISSVHEPCPSDVSTEELKNRDWLISSSDENSRKQGVKAIMRSIDLAQQLHVPVIVVHCGMVTPDLSTEKELRTLFEAGKSGTDEYQALKKKMIGFRNGIIAPRFEAVKRSLLELLDYAAPYQIRLGLENRYHYYDIPTLEEMGQLLDLAGPEQLGFVYDVGHAQAMDRLGFFQFDEWLKRYASRMVEVHLHDVIGVNDHFAPGLGEVDFSTVARYIPQDALRTCELQVVNSPEQVKAGLNYLVQTGCVNPMK